MGGLSVDKVRALQLNFEGLLKLNNTDSERFWEILKGITTPRETEIANVLVENMANSLKSVTVGIQQLQHAASEKAL